MEIIFEQVGNCAILNKKWNMLLLMIDDLKLSKIF